jgi:hypothetical protein
MDAHYVIGVMLGILSGVIAQTGVLLQKKVVNAIPQHEREHQFMKVLIKKPLWILGIVLNYVVTGVVFYFAQIVIGPTLLPGLAASGLVVLAIGSVWINGETLNMIERAGIPIMILGIFFLGLSALVINAEQTRSALADNSILIRVAVFTVVILILWAGTHLGVGLAKARKVVVIAISTGFPFALVNFWPNPLFATMPVVLTGNGTITQMIIMVVSTIILIGLSILGAWQVQVAFKYGQASNIIPVQQVPMQIIPILIYFQVYKLAAPSPTSVYYITFGALLIILGGFLLGRRSSLPDEPRLSREKAMEGKSSV